MAEPIYLGTRMAGFVLLLLVLIAQASGAKFLAGAGRTNRRSGVRGDVYIVRLRSAPVAMQVNALETPSPADLKLYGTLQPDDVSTNAVFAASVNAAADAAAGATTTRKLLAEDAPSAAEDGVSARSGRRKLAQNWGTETRNGRPWFDQSSALIQSLVASLKDDQDQVARQAGLNIKTDILYRYLYISNGFAAVLTAAQADVLRKNKVVLSVVQSRTVQKQTSETPLLLNLPQTFWRGTYTGEEKVIGVVDTGIWPENPSFADDGYSKFPPNWHGQPTDCKRTPDFKRCTRKLVQASFFLNAFEAEFGSIDVSNDWRSPRDADGHGSWVAAAAAGNQDTDMLIARGQSAGKGSGVAPRARIAAYKVFWRNAASRGQVATTADIESAMDQAVADGCDVILLAAGAVDGAQSYFDDLSALYAAMAGTLVVTAAGNGGPGREGARTVANFSPFYLTVGASTINRRFSAKLTLSNGVVLDVNGMGSGNAAIVSTPIIHSPDAKLKSASVSKADQCARGTLDRALVAGKLVVCVAGGFIPLPVKVAEALRAGARGVVLHSSPRTNQPYAEGLPVVGVSVGDSDDFLAFLKTANPRATLSPGYTTENDLTAPLVYPASATGPLSQGATSDILKPDLVAPGAFIWAAGAGDTETDPAAFRIASGTSMSAALVAGVVALLFDSGRKWTPIEVMSAITTTANASMVRKDPFKPVGPTPWEIGAGHVDVDTLYNPGPGLVYSAELPHYARFLVGQNKATALKILQDGQDLRPLAARDLNRATISVSNLQGPVTVMRFVTNLGRAASYTARVVEPAGVDVVVTPASFTIDTGAANAVIFTVKLIPRTGAAAGWKFGSLTWVGSAGHVVKSVIAVET